MKVLLITDEEWNDFVVCNGVLTNWFAGFPAEFAQIYVSPGLPNNNICKKYFQITDTQMVCSIIGAKAGREIQMPTDTKMLDTTKINARRKGIYGFMKKMSLWCRTPVVMLQDAIWALGRFNNTAIEKFVKEFNPDIVFCPRMFNPRLGRIEKLVSSMTTVPFVAFTADNEASFNCYSLSPLFWLRRLYIHRMFTKHVALYKHYFMFSEEQAQEYNMKYNISTSCLYKCGVFSEYEDKAVNKSIRMVYAGRLYCNRWKTLVAIGKALENINRRETRIVLDVYTADTITGKQKKALLGCKYLFVHNPITPSQLTEEYRKADIALHVESFDKSCRLETKYSFSTKIIDLMASTCAIMAICWDRHAGYQYLKKHDAAICVSDYEGILPTIERICQNPGVITEYAKKAWICGKVNHSREKMHKQLNETFKFVIENSHD